MIDFQREFADLLASRLWVAMEGCRLTVREVSKCRFVKAINPALQAVEMSFSNKCQQR